MFVDDVCHILKNDRYNWKSTAWNRAGMPPTQDLANGYTDILVNTRFFTWRRHYTRDNFPPNPLAPPTGWITIDEWVPGVWPFKKDRKGWLSMGNAVHHGIAYIDRTKEITATWSTHAKRHLKTFFASGCTVREGTFEDVETDMLKSQVPRTMSLMLARIVANRLQKDPENINIFVAQDKNQKRIACFVCGNDAATKESMYIMGYFLPEAGKLQPMTGLVYTWLSLLKENGWRSGNFGLMLGPNASKLDPWWGLSNFKTHFGITRVHLPMGYWKIRSSLKKQK